MRYVGNYSAIVTIDFNLDANDRTLLPFDEIKENLSQFSTMLKELIEAELDEMKKSRFVNYVVRFTRSCKVNNVPYHLCRHCVGIMDGGKL